MPETKLDGILIPYTVRRSEEASRPRIDHELGNFTVVIPKNQDIGHEELLERKKSWVLDKRKEFLRFKRKIPERKFEEGEQFPILGNEKRIKVEKRRSNELAEDIILAEHLVDRTSIKDQLEKLLRDEARRTIEKKIEEYEDQIDEGYQKIYIRDQKTKWGSCSSNGNLNFNWRLILAPEHVLEYVVVHELVHLEERNHNESFWKRVGELFPDYRESNLWLGRNSAELVFEREKIVS